jgi:hypothetical protein
MVDEVSDAGVPLDGKSLLQKVVNKNQEPQQSRDNIVASLPPYFG